MTVIGSHIVTYHTSSGESLVTPRFKRSRLLPCLPMVATLVVTRPLLRHIFVYQEVEIASAVVSLLTTVTSGGPADNEPRTHGDATD